MENLIKILEKSWKNQRNFVTVEKWEPCVHMNYIEVCMEQLTDG